MPRDLLLRPAAALRALALGALVALCGCRGERSDYPPRQFFPDMDDGPKWKPQSESQFFADGRTMRPRVEGTVAFGASVDASPEERERYLKDDAAFYFGVDEAGAPLDYIPPQAFARIAPHAADAQEAVSAAIARGQDRFNIYCSACHGYQGNGRGTVGERWSSFPANFHEAKFLDRSTETGKDGHFFQVIRDGFKDVNGVEKMPPYGHALSEADAWAVVAYVRTLQESWTTSLEGIPQERRSELERSRPPAPEAPAAPAGTTPSGATPTTPSPAPASTTPTGQPTSTPGDRR